MKTYPTAKIRNVALVGHGGAGKTSLAEALLFCAGAIPRMGRVEDGTTVTDFDPEEQKRHISVSLSLAPFELEGHKVNVIDAPGYADFVGDVISAMQAADLALFVVSAVEGVEVQTEIAWRIAEQRNLPRAIFVNKLDRERASFERTLEQLKEKFGAGVAPLQLPIGEEADLRGVIDLLNDRAFTYAGDSAKGTEGEVPDEMANEEHAVHDALIEGIVVADDDLMERYLGDETIDYAELAKALASGVASGTVFPVLCGSATKLIGVDRLAHFLIEEGPAPAESNNGATGALVFKTLVDPYVGHVNLFKVLQGTVKHDDMLSNSHSKHDERMHQLFSMRGKEQDTVQEVTTGDIAAVAKLGHTGTGDVLATKGTTLEVDVLEAPKPLLAVAIHPKNKADEDKLANALHKLHEEDPVLEIERTVETHQTVLRGMGETHLSIALEKLHKFGVDVETEDVRVAYRETISGSAEAEGKVKKQSGGHGQFAVAWLRVEPKERGEGNEFVDAIVGGVIPRNFIPAVEKGVHDAQEHGGALGFPVVDVKVTVFDGKHHSVDSSEMAFKTASAIGLREALGKAQPVLLEPVSELVVIVPEANQGDIMGDFNSKRGRIQGSASIGGGEVEIVAHVPTSEVLRYAIELRSMTGGRGRFTMEHSHYDPVPTHVVDKVVAAAKEAAAH
ncbi:MAG TPA: elongation factor G [Acidimicrobiia bacterium]|nr:elongation factor G [Acidimicrobiia bacterium]